jgi:hypothetical protein
LSIDYSGNSSKKSHTYGVSFSKFHSDELKLNWRETYLAILNDLGVRNFRFTAHWPMTEPADGRFNFTELDFQMNEARKAEASVILAVGRRVPGWPECHVPDWAAGLSREAQEEKILRYIEATVKRYKDYPNMVYWQVENEPYLLFFSRHACGDFNEDFLKKEIELVRKLDPDTPIILTDSGEMSTWHNAYRNGDAFGTSIYLYIWNHKIGKFRYPITHHFFRVKHNVMKLLFGEKKSIVIELSAEPWLIQPIIDVPVETQLERMGLDKFNQMLAFSAKTGFDDFYLWGAEWWYWLKQNGREEHWQRAHEIFR